MNKKLTGVFIPVITPFTNQKVDLGMLEHNIRRANSSKVAGYMPLGSNGEFAHLNDEEQLAVFRTVKKNAAKDKVLMIGIARHSAYCTIEFGKKIQEEGADFVSVLCPSYFASSMNDAALIRYYTAVADGLSIPVLLYNCPKFAAGVTLSPEVVKELSKHPNIAGMKDTSKGNIEKYLEVKDESFEVVAGSIENFLTGLKSGASGGVLSMANYLPDPCCRIQELFSEGRIQEAEELSDKLIALSKGAAGKYGVAGVKAACDMFGYKGGEVRNPLADCTDDQRDSIRHAFAEAGYL
jgi:4-hydroxy-2-oxoglutarate aldolase